MKAQNVVTWFSFVFFVTLASGCGVSNEKTDINSATPAESILASTPTVIPISTPTLIVIPTLQHEEAQRALLEMLSANGYCKLPCLWGIMPMKSSFQEARTILVPLSILSGSVYLDSSGEHGYISPRYRYPENNLEIFTSIAFLTNFGDDIVNRIEFRAEAHKPLVEGGYENIFDSNFFSETASAYMLPHVLSEQGLPESVMINTSGGPLTRGGTGGFEIVLLYPNQGIFVHYTTQMYIVGDYVRGCPQSPLIWMELFPPDDSDNFFAELGKTNWQYFKDGFKPLEETTSMSVEEFYETFRAPTEKCIETPANLWPIPEP